MHELPISCCLKWMIYSTRSIWWTGRPNKLFFYFNLLEAFVCRLELLPYQIFKLTMPRIILDTQYHVRYHRGKNDRTLRKCVQLQFRSFQASGSLFGTLILASSFVVDQIKLVREAVLVSGRIFSASVWNFKISITPVSALKFMKLTDHQFGKETFAQVKLYKSALIPTKQSL